MTKDNKNIEEFTEEIAAEPLENETPLSEIVDDVEDKKILEPKKENKSRYTFGYVISNGVYFREQPNKYANIICILKKDDVLLVDKEESGYYYGTANGRAGYVEKEFIEIR